MVLNWQFLDWIWRPDTYFVNGAESYLHKVAVPNRFIRCPPPPGARGQGDDTMTRIAPHGRVSYSQRLTVTARCKMNLRKVTYRQMTDDR